MIFRLFGRFHKILWVAALFAAAPEAAYAYALAPVPEIDQLSVLLFGFLFGAVLSAATYLFFIWVVMHDRGQVFLIIFLLCLCVNIFSLNNMLMGQIGIVDVSDRNLLSNVSLLASLLFALFFTYYFLELAVYSPGFGFPFVLFGFLLTAALMFAIVDRALISFLIPTIGTFVVSLILFAGLSGVKNRTSGSLVHIAAFICFLGGILAEPAYSLGYLETESMVNNAISLSFAMASMMFALVIANQFAARQDEKEKALAISNERFVLATKGANEGLFDWNLKTGEVFFSDQFRRILGYRLPNNTEGLKKWLRMIRHDDRLQVIDTFRKFRHNATAVSLTVEYCLTQTDDDLKWLHTKAIAVRGRTTRRIMRVVGSTNDVTERKKGEVALLASESRFRGITEAHPVPVMIVSLENGEILYVTPGARQLLEMTRENADNALLGQFLPDPDVRGKLLGNITPDDDVNGVEAEIVTGSCAKIPVAIYARRLMYQNQEAIAMGLHDLTERRKAEVKIAQQQEALQQSEKMAALGGLLAGVAHELNNPLSVVVGQSTLLMEGAPEARVATRAEKIFKAADRCSRIVKSFLALARRKPPERKTVDLNQIVRSSIELLGYQLKTGDIEIATDYAPSPGMIIGDNDQLTQVVTNLILNAAQAMESWKGAKRIGVTTRAHDSGHVELVVSDTGPGVPYDIRSRIFEPFFTTKSGKGGTGVGLALCLNIVSAHGGEILVGDTPGGGATFSLTFPPPEKGHVDNGESPSKNISPLPHMKILLVDDEIELAQTLADLLEPEGHTIDIALNGAIAMDKLRKGSFDAIISDLRMPIMDGPALYDALQHELPSYLKRIIFVTGDTLSIHVQEFLRAHAVLVVEKPYRLDDIRHTLAELIKEYNANVTIG